MLLVFFRTKVTTSNIEKHQIQCLQSQDALCTLISISVIYQTQQLLEKKKFNFNNQTNAQAKIMQQLKNDG